MPQIITIATGNRGKIREITEILAQYSNLSLRGLVEIGFSGTIVEDAPTFAGNALIKARAVHRHTPGPTLADDSGLEVLALGGAPGIYTARYAGEGATDEANWRKLLQAMEGVADRRASFRCALAYIDAEGQEFLFEGFCPGEILLTPRGGLGFGYDPVFLPHGSSHSFAQMAGADKERFSHRGAALKKFSEHLRLQ
jgi:XTP/dITP diphosphohydrolase